ncbi:MAG: hypothetical protein OEN23_03295 [Paracoccaceae bacterium]|nr:hypothetical protein [Paracoccaceae bacterium]
MKHRAKVALVSLVAMLAASELASADTDCGVMLRLIEAARNGEALRPAPRGAEECGRSVNLAGQTAVHCAWAFALRAPEARAFFDGVAGSVTTCFGTEIKPIRDLGVNHPDSYDLRQYRIEDVTLSISLKDKAALGKTYVFARAERQQ